VKVLTFDECVALLNAVSIIDTESKTITDTKIKEAYFETLKGLKSIVRKLEEVN
jgi:hypothetical protein